MTCKDCILNKICSTYVYVGDDGDICPYFADNSQYIKLPCKVGDTVYFLDTKYEKHGRKKVPVEYVEVDLVDNIVFGHLGVPFVNVYDDYNIFITFDGSKDFGKTVFLSKESAEKALREREEK